jgi:hypothetical protein
MVFRSRNTQELGGGACHTFQVPLLWQKEKLQRVNGRSVKMDATVGCNNGGRTVHVNGSDRIVRDRRNVTPRPFPAFRKKRLRTSFLKTLFYRDNVLLFPFFETITPGEANRDRKCRAFIRTVGICFASKCRCNTSSTWNIDWIIIWIFNIDFYLF